MSFATSASFLRWRGGQAIQVATTQAGRRAPSIALSGRRNGLGLIERQGPRFDRGHAKSDAEPCHFRRVLDTSPDTGDPVVALSEHVPSARAIGRRPGAGTGVVNRLLPVGRVTWSLTGGGRSRRRPWWPFRRTS